MHSDAHLGPGWDPGARRRARAGFIYSQNLAMAADGHALGKRYLCWHHQGDFDVRTLFQANIGEEVNASGTQVLSEALLFFLAGVTADGDGQGEIKTLGGATLKSNGSGRHGCLGRADS